MRPGSIPWRAFERNSAGATAFFSSELARLRKTGARGVRASAGKLYDLESDPYEMTNLVNDPKMAGVVADLQGELQRLVLDAMGLGSDE